MSLINSHLVGALGTSTAFFTGGSIVFAVTEQVQIAAIGAVVSLVTGGLTIYFAYKAKIISQKTAVAVDGKMDKMLEVAKALAHSEGMVQGTADAETKAAVHAAAKAEGMTQRAPQVLTPDAPLLPTQAQPVAVKDAVGVKLTEDQLEKMISELQAELKENRMNPPAK